MARSGYQTYAPTPPPSEWSLSILPRSNPNCGLPAGPFQAVLRLERRITRDGNVWVNGNLYSVQKITRKRMVEVHGVAHEIRVLEQGQIIAVHAMMPGRGHCCIAAGHHTSPTARRHGAGYRSPSGPARPSCRPAPSQTKATGPHDAVHSVLGPVGLVLWSGSAQPPELVTSPWWARRWPRRQGR